MTNKIKQNNISNNEKDINYLNYKNKCVDLNNTNFNFNHFNHQVSPI